MKKNPTAFAIAIIAAVIIVPLFIWCANLFNENAKYKAFLDQACKSTAYEARCKEGVRMIMQMDIKDIKNIRSLGF